METLHPIAIHLPLVLVFLAPLVDTLGFFAKKPDFCHLAVALYALAILASLFATATGQAAFEAAVAAGHTGEVLSSHADDANLVPWLLILVLVIRVVAPKKLGRSGHVVGLLAGFLMWPFIYRVGASGGALVYDHGIGVKTHAEAPAAPER